MENYKDTQYDEERALYGVNKVVIDNCQFDGPKDGESALKESSNIKVLNSNFNLRYPFWHDKNAKIDNCTLTENCRAALWYDTNVEITNSKLNGIKALRECKGVTLNNCEASSKEFLWRCTGVKIKDSTIDSEYPFFGCKKVSIDKLNLVGKYSFQYVEGMTITNSNLETKDAFWHSKNVTVKDSVIKGEYLGWYSKNLTLINCKIVGTQPLCYCNGLKLIDCTMEQTDLAFERSSVKALVHGNIDSVKNPKSGIITADSIGELLVESAYVNSKKTKIVCPNIGKSSFVEKQA